MRSYYTNTIEEFIDEKPETILGRLSAQHQNRSLEDTQRNAWCTQIEILQKSLRDIEGHIYFEFTIPRMGKRVDNVLIISDKIFIVEFKIGSDTFQQADITQVIDYALDLKNFHAGSHHQILVPVLIANRAESAPEIDFQTACRLEGAICQNAASLHDFLRLYNQPLAISPDEWENAPYQPTPTIIEAAQALYQKHDVHEITRSDAGAINLSATAGRINHIVEQAKAHSKKAICFITGVPGAGKTLAGLNIANGRMNTDDLEHAVFLSGNGPLVTVLREALIRDSVQQKQARSKKDAESQVKAFIQNIHHFRDEYLKQQCAPIEKVVVFDEAQRAWNLAQASKFMKQKRGLEHFNQSEPEFLIEVMNRHQDWCVIVCLIGGGQEINTGEAGLSEWISALKIAYPDWQVHFSASITQQKEYLQDKTLIEWLNYTGDSHADLHLATSIRSFRSEKLSECIQAILDNDFPQARKLYQAIQSDYPIVLTRDLEKAKNHLRQQAKGSERFGLVASSGGRRLKALGVNVKNEIDVAHWFLDDAQDVRSSYALEDVATEFEVQGLELDWACVAWDGNFYHDGIAWRHQIFKGSQWQNINQLINQQYLKNAYRVLLTRARQGLVIWIPTGSETDHTRPARFYDGTYDFLKRIGLKDI